MVWIVQVMGLSPAMYIHYVMELTGVTALLVMIPAVWLYRRDKIQRRESGLIPSREKSLKLWEMAALLVVGAGMAMYANMLLGMIQSFLAPSDYFETMNAMTDGKSVLLCLFWMGIVCPVAEEMIFRWLIFLRLRDYLRLPAACVISGILFGVYHGDLLQGVYAGILGMAFAWLLEITGNRLSCVLLHIGANVWSVLFSTYGTFWLEKGNEEILLLILGMLLFSLLMGIPYFQKKYRREKIRTV